MTAIHLIQKRTEPALMPKPKAPGAREFESGYWCLSQEQATAAIGATIYFHEKQGEPSFFGGTITGFRVQEDGEWKDRVLLTFEPSRSCRGVRAGRDGWAFEKKIVQ